MDMTRRNFIGGLGAGAALAAMPGCGTAVCRAARQHPGIAASAAPAPSPLRKLLLVMFIF